MYILQQLYYYGLILCVLILYNNPIVVNLCSKLLIWNIKYFFLLAHLHILALLSLPQLLFALLCVCVYVCVNVRVMTFHLLYNMSQSL